MSDTFQYSADELLEENRSRIEALNEVIQSTYESVVTEMDIKATAEEKIADWFTTVVTVLPISTALIAEIIKNRRKK